jgi:hypothetical protein
MELNVTFSDPVETKAAVDFADKAETITVESFQPAKKMAVDFSEDAKKMAVNFSESDEETPAYFGEMQIVKVGAPKIGYITLLANAWDGADNLYSQIVSVDGATENSQVDLTPSIEQLSAFYEKDIAFVTENDDGVVTVYAIGQKPENDYTIQVTITEVSV